MRQLRFLATGAVAAALLSSSAFAWTGVATGDVNLRSDDSVRAYRLTTLPEGARVEVHGCPSWCNLTYRGITGWASSSYIASANYDRGPRVYYDRAPRQYYGGPRRWRDHSPRYRRHWGGPGFGIQFGF